MWCLICWAHGAVLLQSCPPLRLPYGSNSIWYCSRSEENKRGKHLGKNKWNKFGWKILPLQSELSGENHKWCVLCSVLLALRVYLIKLVIAGKLTGLVDHGHLRSHSTFTICTALLSITGSNKTYKARIISNQDPEVRCMRQTTNM